MDKKPLTIVKVLYGRPHIGGSGISGTQLAVELGKRGHDVHIVSYPDTYLLPEEEKYVDHHAVSDFVYGSFKHQPFTASFPSKIIQLAQNRNIDVLHAHYGVLHGEVVNKARDIIKRYRRLGKLPLQSNDPISIITNRGTDITVNGHSSQMLPALEEDLNNADYITFVSKTLRNEAVELFDLDNQGSVIYNFIQSEKFSRPEGDVINLELRNKYGVSKDDLVFYHVSNFRPVKNTSSILPAYKLALENGMTNSKFLFIGDGPDKHKVKNQVTEFGLEDKVIFTGLVSPESVPNYSQMGNILVLPSFKESFGRVNLEAMHLGNAVLASKVGGIPEVVHSGVTGYLFDPKNTDELASYMKLLSERPDIVQRFGNAGKLIAESTFGLDTIVDQYEQLYYRLVDSKKSSIDLVSKHNDQRVDLYD